MSNASVDLKHDSRRVLPFSPAGLGRYAKVAGEVARRRLRGPLYMLSIVAAVGSQFLAAQAPAQRLAEPWQSPYVGEDATGQPVLGLWNFDEPAPLADSSGRDQNLALEGARIAERGRYGSCLESFAGYPVADERHRAVVKNAPKLAGKGALSLEMWIAAKPELAEDYPDAFLLDKKYVDHTDFQLVLGDADRLGARSLRAVLGFGGDSETWTSRPLKLVPGEWHHLAFTYDGAGTGAFFVDGKPWGNRTAQGREGISAGDKPLSIGDRIGSLYHGFPGFIDQVRITAAVLEFSKARFERVAGRRCYQRMEPEAMASFRVTNLQRQPLAGGKAVISAYGLRKAEIAVPDLAPGASAVIDYKLDTSLRPDNYLLTAGLLLVGSTAVEGETVFPVEIVARQPVRMPVVMWGMAANDQARLKEIGFTHSLGLRCDTGRIWEAGKPIEAADAEGLAEAQEMLDNALSNGIRLAIGLAPGRALRDQEEWRRITVDGKPASEDICARFPQIEQFCYNVGASVAKSYASHPAFDAAMLHTEVRGESRPCYHAHDREAFRRATGIDIPAGLPNSQRGVDYTALAGFPADRVIPDDHPLYVYYRWFWREGDGWNALNTAVDRGLKSTGRRNLWTWYDPAVRVAKVFGSGGHVDVISQWTYSYPDPIRIGLAADELLAMARGAGFDQRMMKMTQIIWYRTQTAPAAKAGEVRPYLARWEQEQPDAPFITIAPAHLREAFWTKIARPVQGIMYHGWQSLVPVDRPASYRYTNPATSEELGRLIRQVVRPLGPSLLAVPPVKSDVAFLESFAAETFAKRGTYGWNGGWAGDAYHAVLYAGLQPEIIYDETVVLDGLDQFRVLVMADCDVITASVRDAVRRFQARGGLVVGDERLSPAIRPDIVLPVYVRTGRADADKQAILTLAAGLRRELGSRYARYVSTSNPEVLPYLRRYGTTDYVFLVNDRREYGEYVGQHGVVMENGLPSVAEVALARGGCAIYDLIEGRQVPTRRQGQSTVVEASLGPCDGQLLMATAQPIDRVEVKTTGEAVDRGGRLTVEVGVVGRDGRVLDAVVPLELTIRDPEGRIAERSGFYAAVGGRVRVDLEIAANDARGIWQIAARELASRRSASADVRVRGPEPWPPAAKPISKDLANPVQPKG